MKILWVKTDFLHPTTRGGQIRTLEMLRQLAKRHEIHYVAFDDPSSAEGVERSGEYASAAYPIAHKITSKSSPLFLADLLRGVVSELPVAGFRYRSEAMRTTIERLQAEHQFDARVCDFLFPSANLPSLKDWTLFQHNVESVIWDRHAESGRTLIHKAYFRLQAKKMNAWEQDVCRSVANVVAVSETDADVMKARFGVSNVTWVPTGVDLDYFRKRESGQVRFDLVFVGSMDWMPNIDGMQWFLDEILPLIRKEHPGCRLAIAGRRPPAALVERARELGVEVTGTVPDVRPYLWDSLVSIVPLRVGGGTRLKIFEAMAAGVPVVSTSVGAEGLPAVHDREILIGDTPDMFAAACIRLLDNVEKRQAISNQALRLVTENFSWERVTDQFEEAIRLPAPLASSR